MSDKSTTAPTAAARRASEKVCRFATNRVVSADEIRKIAALIDCETGLPELIAERDRLAAIVQRLPRTADGVPVVPGMTLYSEEGIAHEDFVWYTDLENWKNWYSTPAAALAAASIKPEGT